MIEKVIWDDAGSFGTEDEVWLRQEDIIDNYRRAQFQIVSVGHVIHEDDDSLILAQSHDSEYNQYSDPLRIPKRMIVRRIEMEDTKFKKDQANG